MAITKTPNETEIYIVQGLARGKNQRRIAGALGWDDSKVSYKLGTLRRLYQAGHNAHLVAIFMREGWVK